jgi:hypothetical protein
MRTIHLGNAVVLFENALDATDEEISSFIENTQNYVENEEYKESSNYKRINGSGYEFDEAEYAKVPSRFMNLSYPGMTDTDKQLVSNFKKTLYNCLVEYCRLFPVAAECVKWHTNGYMIRYKPGQSIGPHSDAGLPYDANGEAVNQFPLYNTLTSGIFLNDDFVGGELYFRPWGITARPVKRSAIIYPSSFTGCHEVNDITEGVRYAYLQWFCHGGDAHNANPNSSLPNLKQDIGAQYLHQQFVPVGPVSQS